ncbi:MAG: ankyrin repeat domain-containing protein [Candidatus Latescibacterota bacterium]|jgi:ankyrin repeat protein
MLGWLNRSRQRKLDAALFEAVYQEDPDAVQRVLADGACPDARRQDGQTPLMRAASEGQAAIARLLLEGGADVQAQSETGETALLLAIQPEFAAEGREETGLSELETFDEIPEAEADAEEPEDQDDGDEADGGSPEFDRAVLETGQVLLAAGARVDQADRDGNTPLIKAAFDGRLDFAAILLAAGADVHQANRQGISALLAASAGGRTDLIEALLAAGADPNRATPEGLTPLMLAAARGQVAVATVLLAAGADPTARDGEGRSAAALAEAAGQDELARALGSNAPE